MEVCARWNGRYGSRNQRSTWTPVEEREVPDRRRLGIPQHRPVLATDQHAVADVERAGGAGAGATDEQRFRWAVADGEDRMGWREAYGGRSR